MTSLKFGVFLSWCLMAYSFSLFNRPVFWGKLLPGFSLFWRFIFALVFSLLSFLIFCFFMSLLWEAL